MPPTGRTLNYMTEACPAGWELNKRARPYSEAGSAALDARDAEEASTRPKQPWASTHTFPDGDVRDPVTFRTEDGSFKQTVYQMRKLGAEEAAPPGKIKEHPSARDSHWASLKSTDGTGRAEFDPRVTFVTPQGRYTAEFIMESSPTEPEVDSPTCYTSTSWITSFQPGYGMRTVRDQDYFPPTSICDNVSEAGSQIQQFDTGAENGQPQASVTSPTAEIVVDSKMRKRVSFKPDIEYQEPPDR